MAKALRNHLVFAQKIEFVLKQIELREIDTSHALVAARPVRADKKVEGGVGTARWWDDRER